MFDAPVTSPDLTTRQQAVLDVLRSYGAEHGYPPTVREIGALLGLASSSTVHSHLGALERAGIVERDPSKPRALRWGPNAEAAGVEAAGPTGGPASPSSSADADTDASVSLPMLGRVAAGAPILAEQHLEGHLPVPRQLTRTGDSFVLKVRGDSMEGAGILDGDWIVVRHQKEASNGQIVVALVEDDADATCKRFERRDGRVLLHSENPAYPPLEPEHCEVAGIVTGVMRAL
ncbi:MAG: SOS-response transcriptional repressor, LexA [Thermoleophilia bacterium]|nr:SOS-response transcriptional repressor, LexA [Thermoleophilia bacterium]